MSATRPNPAQWLWYAYGGALPDHLREWVLYDATCRTWVLRHLSRTLAQWAPTTAFLLLPGPWLLRLSLPLFVLVGAVYASLSYIVETTEHRVAKHGYPLGIARELRLARREVDRIEHDPELRGEE